MQKRNKVEAFFLMTLLTGALICGCGSKVSTDMDVTKEQEVVEEAVATAQPTTQPTTQSTAQPTATPNMEKVQTDESEKSEVTPATPEVSVETQPQETSDHTCPDCNGTGIVCSECNGTTIVKCKACNQTGYESCNTCGGSGMIACHHCKGAGKLTPNGEKAPGEAPDEDAAPAAPANAVTCNFCNGTGQQVCDVCHGAPSKLCTHCQGQLTHLCPVCNGNKNCKTCGGTGTV